MDRTIFRKVAYDAIEMETKLTFPFSKNSSFEKSILLRNEKGMCEYLHKDLLEMIIKYTTYRYKSIEKAACKIRKQFLNNSDLQILN